MSVQVHISLQYEIPVRRLTVRMIEAKDLPLPSVTLDRSGSSTGSSSGKDSPAILHSNPYARVRIIPIDAELDPKGSDAAEQQLLQHSRQTSVQRKTQNPVWDETFRFASLIFYLVYYWT